MKNRYPEPRCDEPLSLRLRILAAALWIGSPLLTAAILWGAL